MPATSSRWNCSRCRRPFRPSSHRQKYCSVRCRQGTAVCVVCRKTFVRVASTTGRFCSKNCAYARRTRPELRRRACLNCRKSFKPVRPEQFACSPWCGSELRRGERACRVCGKRFRNYKHPTNPTCSRACAGKLRRKPLATGCERCGGALPEPYSQTKRFCSLACRWLPLGTTRTTMHGYLVVRVPKGTPGADDKGWIFQHRWVMANSLGRPLLRSERVHHINGKRDDNRPENLELWTDPHKNHPRGVRATDYHCPGCRCANRRKAR